MKLKLFKKQQQEFLQQLLSANVNDEQLKKSNAQLLNVTTLVKKTIPTSLVKATSLTVNNMLKPSSPVSSISVPVKDVRNVVIEKTKSPSLSPTPAQKMEMEEIKSPAVQPVPSQHALPTQPPLPPLPPPQLPTVAPPPPPPEPERIVKNEPSELNEKETDMISYERLVLANSNLKERIDNLKLKSLISDKQNPKKQITSGDSIKQTDVVNNNAQASISTSNNIKPNLRVSKSMNLKLQQIAIDKYNNLEQQSSTNTQTQQEQQQHQLEKTNEKYEKLKETVEYLVKDYPYIPVKPLITLKNELLPQTLSLTQEKELDSIDLTDNLKSEIDSCNDNYDHSYCNKAWGVYKNKRFEELPKSITCFKRL